MKKQFDAVGRHFLFGSFGVSSCFPFSFFFFLGVQGLLVLQLILCRTSRRWSSCTRFLSYVALLLKNIGKSQSCRMQLYLSLNNHTNDALLRHSKIFHHLHCH